MLDRNLAQDILARALARGGEYADLFVEARRTAALVFEGDRMESVVDTVDAGAGLRVLFGGRTAYGYTNDGTPAGLRALASEVAAAAREGVAGCVAAFAGPLRGTFAGRHPGRSSLSAKARLVASANAAARGRDPRVRQVRITYRDVAQRLAIFTSTGDTADGERVLTTLAATVVAGEGDRLQTGYVPVGGTVGMELFDAEPAEAVATRAADLALVLLDAAPAPSGPMPVVLSSEAGGTMVHEAVGHGLEADLAGEGLSVYGDRIGDVVAAPIVSVVDDATLPGRRGSFAFDDEAVPGARTVLVERGVLRGYLHDRRSAMKLAAAPTGNGRRESYRHAPIPRMTNIFIAPGDDDPEAIVRSVDRGLFVRRMGGGQVNTVNGDFVFEVVEGYRLEHGRIGEPVRGATLTGNGPAVLTAIDRVGRDLGFAIGTCGKDGQGVPVADAQPTLRIPEIIVGGTA
ncbi:MAG TPA: TldD/PmbA family protein [Thermodesulfobacteriota bacterium]